MGLLDRIFNFVKSDETEVKNENNQPNIRLGRYSDNNKSLAQTKQWTNAEQLFNEKKYDESIEAFFNYLRDEVEDNVRLVKEADQYSFEIYQGTKIVHGSITPQEVVARVSLAKMEQNSTPVMRRLLEMNYSLFYTRYALEDKKLCMTFDSPRDIASPNKLYYGLKELATKADKQDDLLLTDFATLQNIDDSHIEMFSSSEIEVKYNYFKKWIDGTILRIDELNQDSFSGGIGYMLLTLIFKLDFLITPEGKLLNELESINQMYWSTKDEKTSVERNHIMKDALQKLSNWSKEDVVSYFYKAKASFAITVPKPFHEVAESIRLANENAPWYFENKHEDIGFDVLEYGLAYCQYSYSLPKPVTQLFTLYMQINHSAFFDELGFNLPYLQKNTLQSNAIITQIKSIIHENNERYPKLAITNESLKFDSIENFNLSFLEEITKLNFDAK